MKHNVLGILTSIVLLTTITGCGASYPNLTQEQYDQTVDYAAGLLMKYSNNNIDRLTDVAVSTSADTSEESVSDSSENGYSLTDAGNNSSAAVSVQADSIQNSSSTASTDAQDNLNDSQDETAKMLNGILLKYNGYSVMNAYPADDAQGAVSVDKGMKLLILNFTISNHTTKEIKLNMAKKQASFLISVNGEKQGYTMVTMLDNDLTTYQGSVPPGKSTDLVLLLDLPESIAKSANTLGITMKIDNQTCSYILE